MAKKKNGGDYEVGYGKPPKHTRFKPGQSGNPKGRPKGSRNFKTDVQDVLETPVTVTRDGKQKKVSTQRATLLRLREKALSGELRALDRLLGLAQTYNNEELAATDSLSGGDAAILDVFKARVLSGAASAPDPDDTDDADRVEEAWRRSGIDDAPEAENAAADECDEEDDEWLR